MKKLVCGVLLAVVLGFSVFGAEASIVDLGIFDGHQYLYDTGSFYSFDNARQAAQAVLYCDLVSITSATENNFLVTAITSLTDEKSNLRTAWIGLFRSTTTDPWGWVSGEAASYLNWRPAGVGLSWAEPTGETAGVMYINDPGNTIPLGLWGDTYYAGNEAFNAIYEAAIPNQTVPEPTTLLLLGCGFIGIAAIRRCFKK